MAYKFSAAERRLQAELLREQRQNRYAAYQQKKPLATAPKKKNKSGLAVAGATAADVGGNILIGLGKGIEGIYDFGAGLVGAVGGLFSDDFEDSVKQHVARDFTNELYSKLKGCEAHSTVILSHVDEDLFKKIGVNITFEPKYQAKKLFHK